MASAAAIRVSPDATAAADAAAQFLARVGRNAIRRRGTFHVALSGGTTPALMLESFASTPLVWEAVHLWQVDERVAPDGDAARNANMVRDKLLSRVAIPPANVHFMGVTAADLGVSATEYGAALPHFDVVHLGLGDDGHTASWPPGDEAVLVATEPVHITGPFNGHVRMTITPLVVRGAHHVMWLVCGTTKRDVLGRLLRGDENLPASRALDRRSVFFVDQSAAPESSPA